MIIRNIIVVIIISMVMLDTSWEYGLSTMYFCWICTTDSIIIIDMVTISAPSSNIIARSRDIEAIPAAVGNVFVSDMIVDIFII